MLTRVTTNGVLRGYKSQLNRSSNNLNDARNKVLTKRNFNSYAENPAAATKAFQLRRAYSRASDQIGTSTTVINRFESAWTSMGAVAKELYGQSSALSADLEAENDPTGSARQALAQALKASAESIVQDLNVKYGDSFIFAGADGLNVPFSWSSDGKLLYRGVSVDGVKSMEEPKIPTLSVTIPYSSTQGSPPAQGDELKNQTVEIELYKTGANGAVPEAKSIAEIKTELANKIADLNNNKDPNDSGEYQTVALSAAQETAIPQMQTKYNADTNAYTANQKAVAEANQLLQALSKETNYADVGLGLQENMDGSLITSSAYNYAIPGLDMLGFGMDEDGDPKNVVSIVMRLSEIYGNCDSNGGFADGEEEEANRLLDKLQASTDSVQNKYVELDGKAKFLKTNKSRLEDYANTLNEEILSIEQVDLADAITEFSWAQYCYNAALKVGNSILSQSLIDYMG